MNTSESAGWTAAAHSSPCGAKRVERRWKRLPADAEE